MANNRLSSYTAVSTGSGSKLNDNVSASGVGADGLGKKKDLWNSMLDSVASGRKLPERNVLVFGGSVDAQREFLESVALDPRRDRQQHNNNNAKVPPVANSFALGYTYYDVLDADQEDILARISLYLLSNPSPSFSSLLTPLLTPQSIPNTLIVILLDWAQPWQWLRQLREWILLLRTVLVSLSPECKQVMEEAMLQWRERGRGGPVNLDGTTAAVDGDALPPGPGEWEDALGLPLCVVCQNSEKTDILEKTQGWKDDEFDLVLQHLRTVLVKHGASLIYTTPGIPSQLPTLVHACLGVTSLLKRQPLKPEVIKRTEVVVPSNWDSWTKILVVREGFEVDKVSEGWSMDLQRPFPPAGNRSRHHRTTTQRKAARAAAAAAGEITGSGDNNDDEDDDDENANEDNDSALSDDDDLYDAAADDEDPDSAVSQYERAIRDPGMDVLALAGQYAAEADVISSDDEASSGDGVSEDGGGDSAHEREKSHRRHKNGRRHRHRRHRRGCRRQLVEVETEDVQAFLSDQLKLLDQLHQKDEVKRNKESKESKRRGDGGGPSSSSTANAAAAGYNYGGYNSSSAADADPAEVISSHIGPVQFNIGGIQVDADDMLERIKSRHNGGTTSSSPEPTSPGLGGASSADDGSDAGSSVTAGAGAAGVVGGSSAAAAAAAAAASGKSGRGRPASSKGKDGDVPPLRSLESVDTEKMSAFFAGLMKRPSQAGQAPATKPGIHGL